MRTEQSLQTYGNRTFRLKTKSKIKIVELNLTPEKIAQINHIITTEHRTKRNDRIREVLDGSNLCCICGAIPTHRISQDMGSLIRNSSYCKNCFHSIYEKTNHLSNEDLAELYGCIKAEPGMFGGGKKGYSLTAKSSLSERTIICSRCRVTRIFFDNTQRGYNNLLIPLEYRYGSAFRPHDCDISYPFFCVHEGCNTKLYYDRKVRNLRGGLIAMEFETDLPHEVCPGKDTGRNRNVDDV